MALYGQITQLYPFGGADVFEPVAGMRYPVAFENSAVETVKFGDVVSFSFIGETPHAAVEAVVELADVPPEARDALSDLAAGPSAMTG